ncbi:MAG: hypothetical protein N2Z76_01225 [Treponemataceae bacterium]|nr:hypothetical protein [Treponemataceae bacterium]
MTMKKKDVLPTSRRAFCRISIEIKGYIENKKAFREKEVRKPGRPCLAAPWTIEYGAGIRSVAYSDLMYNLVPSRFSQELVITYQFFKKRSTT